MKKITNLSCEENAGGFGNIVTCLNIFSAKFAWQYSDILGY
jgi:hypothetical protein